VGDANGGVSRRRFSTTVAAGGVYAAFHKVLAAEAPQQPRATGSELCAMSAVELAARIARKQVSSREVMTAHLAQIERLNPKVNAIVTLGADQAMTAAAKADEAAVRRGGRWRLAPQSPGVLQRRRATSIARQSTNRVHCVAAVLGDWTDSANRCRYRALSERDCRAGRSQPAVHRGRSRSLSEAPRP
jgi:hypothetical protein